MKIISYNRYGGKSASDIIIHASSFCELSIFCDAVLQVYKGRDYIENSGADRSVKLARELSLMMNPINDKPKPYFTDEK